MEPSANESPLYCVERLGLKAAEEVIELVERSTGSPCACKRGLPCPLRVPVARSS